MGKLTISMAIFNSYVKLPEGTSLDRWCNVKNTEIFGISMGPPWVMDSTDLTWLTRLWLSRLGRPIDHCLWLADALGEFRPFSPDSLAIHPYIDWGSQCCWFHTWSVLSWITRGPCRQTPATKRNPGLCIFRFSQTMGSILENMVSFCCSYVSGCSGTCFRLTPATSSEILTTWRWAIAA